MSLLQNAFDGHSVMIKAWPAHVDADSVFGHEGYAVDSAGTVKCEVGPMLQASPHFPDTVNVGFVEVLGRDHIRLRVFEFGAGETLACGSGACAAAASLMQRGLVDRSVRVSLRGGDLQIDWSDSQASIALTGPARFVFDGVLSDDRTAENLRARLSSEPHLTEIHS